MSALLSANGPLGQHWRTALAIVAVAAYRKRADLGQLVAKVVQWLVAVYKGIIQASSGKGRRSSISDSLREYQDHTDLNTIQACLLSTEHLDIGRIEKRTLFVRKLEEVFPNDFLRQKIKTAAMELSAEPDGDECVLPTKLTSADKWQVLNACTNRVSELFAPCHMHFNEARRNESFYRSAWYVFTMTCTRTSGSGRFFITPSKPVLGKADVGQLRIRIVLISEAELRRIASGELEAPAKGFFNERHNGRWRVLSRVASLFVRQLENVTGESYSVAQGWGSNLCGRIGASALERRNLRIKQYGKNSTQYDFMPTAAAATAAGVTAAGPPATSANDKEEGDDQDASASGEQGYDPYLPEDNCFLRIHIPFPGGTAVPASKDGRKCADVVLFS